jgi:hypothetical protein
MPTGFKKHFEAINVAFGKNPYNDFMIKHAHEFEFGPASFEGPRGEVHGCFMNSIHAVIEDPTLTYVEGKVSCYGVALDHAWCINADGFVVDPTLEDNGQTLGYYGIPFIKEYVSRVFVAHKAYCGVLDPFFAALTAPKLYTLGLEAGQQWLLDLKTSEVPKLKPREQKRRATNRRA